MLCRDCGDYFPAAQMSGPRTDHSRAYSAGTLRICGSTPPFTSHIHIRAVVISRRLAERDAVRVTFSSELCISIYTTSVIFLALTTRDRAFGCRQMGLRHDASC